MIINLVIVLASFATGAAAGILLTIGHHEHLRAEQQADEDALAEIRDLYAVWAMIRSRPGRKGPSAPDPRDLLLL